MRETSGKCEYFNLLALSSNTTRHIVDGADHDPFWRDRETVKVSVAAILQVVEAARTDQPSE
jgi:hypothetical protein